jgi:hypothetical protein
MFQKIFFKVYIYTIIVNFRFFDKTENLKNLRKFRVKGWNFWDSQNKLKFSFLFKSNF